METSGNVLTREGTKHTSQIPSRSHLWQIEQRTNNCALERAWKEVCPTIVSHLGPFFPHHANVNEALPKMYPTLNQMLSKQWARKVESLNFFGSLQ